MTTSGIGQLPSPFARWRRRLDFTWRTLFAPGDGMALLVAVALLLMPALSLSAAGWPLDLRTVIPALTLSIVFGFLLARSQYNELFALLMSGIYGVATVAIIASINEPGNLADGGISVFTRLLRWSRDAVSGGINQDELIFTLLVALLFWFLGYNMAWHLFRVDRVWRVILPPGLILVANTIYYTGKSKLDAYLIVFCFLALILIIRSNLDARAWDWYVNGIRVPRALRRQFYRIGVILGMLAIIFAWVIPQNDLQERLNRFQEFLQSEPLTQLSELWNRLFTSVETQGPTTTDYYGGDSLQLGGAIKLGEQIAFLVAAPPGRRYYWRSRVFDTYDSGRWLPGANTRLTVEQSSLNITLEPEFTAARDAVQQQFTIGLNGSRLVYAAPQPQRVDLPTRTDLLYSPNRTSMNVSVIRPVRVLERGDSYSATSLMTNASAAQLGAANVDYPAWLRDQYLQIPGSVTTRTLQLAQAIVQEVGAVTPYDKAKAIESWLRSNIVYNESIPQPPRGQDPVDWLLFDLKQGYCNYYASAMIMMVRSQGIPARMAAGFSQGTWDVDRGAFVVLERDAHTWVEVFFPGYGWIEFEPTAAQAPVSRVDDTPAGLQPSATPVASPTPTATATPTATPTVNPLTTTPEAQNAQALPTVTPTFTPSPTATPVIVPTQPPPLTPQPRGPLSFILRALAAALVGILLIALLIGLAVFTWWWWEWRGMRGLSPVARAYSRLERYLTLIGLRFGGHQTPDERRERIVSQLPQAEPPVTAITRMYTAERYGPGDTLQMNADQQSEAADDAWSDTRTTILRRWLRRFLPWGRR
jgi:transglutaminase-like putative cysteine protease